MVPIITGTPEIDGYVFDGWATSTTGTAMTSAELEAYAISEDTNLYAIWHAGSYTITYNCGGVAGASTTATGPTTNSQNVNMDGSYTLAAADNCALDGYTFAGWSCPNLTGTPTFGTYFAGGANGTYSYAGDVTCTAQWTANTINLSWDDNNATTASVGGGSTCTFDGSITLPSQVPQRTGYEFGGWEVSNTSAGSQQQGD